MSDLRIIPRAFLSEFIRLYRSNPCLWKIKSKEYSDKNKQKTECQQFGLHCTIIRSDMWRYQMKIHNGNGMVVLQNCADLEKDVRGLCAETCSVSSHDADHFVSIKVEDVLDIKEEKVPLPVTCQAIKAEFDNGMMFLQKDAPHAWSETCPPSSDDFQQVINIKIEEGSDIDEEENFVPFSFSGVEVEHESTLNEPQDVHGQDRPFSCDVCKKSFRQQSHLKEHKRIHTGERPFSCNICNKSFNQQNHLKKHHRTHSGERPFSCSVCNKSFSQQDHLKTHQGIHRGERPFFCMVCNKSFTRQSDLKRHESIHSGYRPFSCNVCNKSFSRQCVLKTHQHIHSGERPFSCNMCDKSYIRHSDLKAHQCIHSGERPFSCNICNKTFMQQCVLKTHQLIHNEEPSYFCNVCNKTFRWESSLKRHLLVHSQ
ncbi:hypothetical protein B7P43_G15296 [Cryptotermes secundus]|uniref:C2H2-type domain-containing protein n=1 Tax=Cryptotermes secundus TaxID=105785 RepID=A0A2J7PIQ9_9NEOP|nr:hypothetical protein B7P43_G15296 [Cryptotermes secundus]